MIKIRRSQGLNSQRNSKSDVAGATGTLNGSPLNNSYDATPITGILRAMSVPAICLDPIINFGSPVIKITVRSITEIAPAKVMM